MISYLFHAVNYWVANKRNLCASMIFLRHVFEARYYFLTEHSTTLVLLIQSCMSRLSLVRKAGKTKSRIGISTIKNSIEANTIAQALIVTSVYFIEERSEVNEGCILYIYAAISDIDTIVTNMPHNEIVYDI